MEKLRALFGRLGTTAFWAAIGAVFRAIFISIIETLGWGPVMTATLFGGGTIAYAWVQNAPWYWIVIPGLIVFAVVMLISVKTAAALRSDRPVAPAPSKRIPLTTLRKLAIEAGWEGDLQAVWVGDNDFLSFTKRLRQAGVDGDIQFSGRKYQDDFRKDTDSTPSVLIPKEHFEDFEFDVLELGQELDNYNIFTGKFNTGKSAFRGQIYRDIYVDEAQSIAWLSRDGKPPEGATFHAKHGTGDSKIGGYDAAYTITVTNVARPPRDLSRCLAQLEQITGFKPEGLSLPLVLRTEGQIRDNRKGRWTLSSMQPKAIPIFFRDSVRKNEWFFFDEGGARYHKPARPVRMVLGIYSEVTPVKLLIDIELGMNWLLMPSMTPVANDYTLEEASDVTG